MRLKKLLPVAPLILGLITGLVWCAGPCCGSMGASPSPLSIGAVSCCGGDTPSRCQPSIQRADDLVAAPDAPSLPPIAILAHRDVPSSASLIESPIATSRATLPRPDLGRLDLPLLI
jgi:hypothetical protein